MKTVRPSIAVLALGTLVLASLLLGGCAKKLEGDAYPNQKPIVWFVNVPPESARSSVNPIINWYGQDQDGQIDFYRYIVIRESIVGDSLGKPVDWNPSQVPLTETEVNTFVLQHLGSVSDTLWTQLVVRADSTDPHTSNVVPMSAEIDDPVLTYVPQFVFVQAFDEEGLGSDVVYRRFLRNDNPPSTRIVGFVDGVPFINSTFPSGSSTGIRIRWTGSDVIDYPSDPPPFEFEWKLFGPYSQTDYDYIFEHFRQEVFVTNDARVLWRGQPPELIVDSTWDGDEWIYDTTEFYTSLIICDTTYEGGSEVITCDTMPVDEFETGNVWGTLDTLLRVYDEEFINSPYYIVADSSHDEWGNVWTTDLRDSIYNVYKNAPADTTQAGKFIFVVRSRDDAKVPDLTPAFRGFTVINPQHELDILIVDWGIGQADNRALNHPRNMRHRRFWSSMVQNWIANSSGHGDVLYDSLRDWRHIDDYVATASTRKPELLLRQVLKYKVAVMVQDIAEGGGWKDEGENVQSILTALQTGVNVWVVARAPYGGPSFNSPFSDFVSNSSYQYFFGVIQYTFPGWASDLTSNGLSFGLPRKEDFVGALSLDRSQWPDLSIDTALLREKYLWAGYVPPPECYVTPGCDPTAGQPFYPFVSDQFDFLGALPQVGWCVRTYDTECMYLFKSLYGNEHKLFRELSFHGRPVAIRLNRGLFRTVHFMFSPLAMKDEQAKELTIEVFNWLYDGRSDLFNTAKRSGQDAALADDLGSRYWDAYWQADGDAEKFYELLGNAY